MNYNSIPDSQQRLTLSSAIVPQEGHRHTRDLFQWIFPMQDDNWWYVHDSLLLGKQFKCKSTLNDWHCLLSVLLAHKILFGFMMENLTWSSIRLRRNRIVFIGRISSVTFGPVSIWCQMGNCRVKFLLDTSTWIHTLFNTLPSLSFHKSHYSIPVKANLRKMFEKVNFCRRQELGFSWVLQKPEGMYKLILMFFFFFG